MHHSTKHRNTGTLYWRPGLVRVWINGKFFDLGARTLEASKVVARELELRLVIQESRFPLPPPARVVKANDGGICAPAHYQEAEHKNRHQAVAKPPSKQCP
jgi:hypothetical protein